MERAAKLSGARFAYLKGDLVMLELALVRWVLEKLRGTGFEPVIPPVLVRERALYGTGFLPDTEQQIYSLPEDELFLVGNLRGGARVAARRGDPRRRAAAAALRGLLAVLSARGGRGGQGHARHLPGAPVRQGRDVQLRRAGGVGRRSTSGSSRSRRRSSASWGCPTASSTSPSSDLGNSAAKKYDCEAWIPSQGRYRELTSCSNTTDYQARRLNIRVRAASKRTQTLHTLNGTAVAVGRTIVALLENGQRADGGVELPQAPGARTARPRLLPPSTPTRQ